MTYLLRKSHPVVTVPSLNRITRPSLQVRAHRRKDEGIPRKQVDANLVVLRERIEVLKMREKLEKCCKNEMGWNYEDQYIKPKNYKKFPLFIQLIGWAIGTCGLTIASGSLCLSLISLMVHLSQ